MNKTFVVRGTAEAGVDINSPEYRDRFRVEVQIGTATAKSVYIKFWDIINGKTMYAWIDPSHAMEIANTLYAIGQAQNEKYPARTVTTYTFPGGKVIESERPPVEVTTTKR